MKLRHTTYASLEEMSSLEDDAPLEETSRSSHSSRDEEFEEALAVGVAHAGERHQAKPM